MSNKSLALVVIIVLVIIGILIAVSMSYNSSPTATQTSTQAPVVQVQSANSIPSNVGASTVATTTVDVVYDGKIFSPSSISINIGDSVKFMNNSTGRMWIASNPHPTHTDLPGFDEKEYIANVQSWTYTFNVLGTHGYHNHANPTIMGTIIVQ